jgi:putative glutamine amidotransferase
MPIIGVTTNHGKNENGLPNINLLRAYVSAILGAGGTPVLIPSELPESSRRELFDRLDGILFTGGGDIACERFKGVPHPRVDGVDADRDNIEYALLQLAVSEGKPFLGICRGFQVINAALGGTLFTHIDDQMPGAIKHDYYPTWPRNYLAHQVTVEKSSHLAEILGATEIQVNSLHHQGADKIAPSLKVVAHASDGLVEGLELPNHPFGLGVQWHPEWLADRPEAQRLFKSFVDACSDGNKKSVTRNE